MTKDEVARIIETIPGGLDPDDFLVALANRVESVERSRCVMDCYQEKGVGTPDTCMTRIMRRSTKENQTWI